MSVASLAAFAAALAAWLTSATPGPATGLALRGDVLLAGTERGLFVHRGSGWDVVLTRGGVLDLSAGPDGLLIATRGGLYEWREGEPRPRPLPLGAGARVRSVAHDAGGSAWVASEVGLFQRAPGARVFEREISLPAGPVFGVRTSGEQLWVATRGSLWRGGASGFRRVLSGLDEGWWELRSAVDLEDDALLCVPRGAWEIGEDGPRRLELPLGELHAALSTEGQLWIASERGVHRFELAEIRGAPGRAELDVPTLKLALVGSRLLAATDRGIAELRRGPKAARESTYLAPSTEPDIRSVQRAALAYLDLAPSRLSRVEELARRTGWLPEVRAGLSVDRARGRDRDRDEVFSSGAVRRLLDSSADRDTSLRVDLELIWDLPRTASPDDALAISRERRQVIELRDQVLERVNRLYFERLRVRAELAGAEPGKREGLGLRSRELAAQLDAWTGGRFSRLREDTPPDTERIR